MTLYCPNCGTRIVTRKTAKADKRAERKRRIAALRETVEGRANGVCELCFSALGVEMHHLLSAGLRQYRENLDTVIMLCAPCHRLYHRSDQATLAAAWRWADSRNYRAAAQAIWNRLERAGRVSSTGSAGRGGQT